MTPAEVEQMFLNLTPLPAQITLIPKAKSVFLYIAAGGRILLAYLLGTGFFARDAVAWGPHPDITAAALKTMPDAARWKGVIGGDNWKNLANKYCWMPDMRGTDQGDFYVDDYLLICQFPHYANHCMPELQPAFVPFFRRALQALRTETPVNACRQIGPILHFVEDAGAPPHAKPNCPHHSELENWVRPEQITIDGYQPHLLGKTDAEAEAGLLRRVAGLVEFSKARAERALPLVSQPSADRAKVEPIILESALESARVAADLLYTLLTLGLAPQPEDAGLSGAVTAGAIPGRNGHGARIVLLNTDFATLALADKTETKTEDAAWHGGYAFRNLPPGNYRVLAYRTASQFRVSEPITLKSGAQARLDILLPETDPPGNLVENPDGRLAYLKPDDPDRWSKKDNTWRSSQIVLQPHTTYRCGAVLKDPAARVSFYFYTTSQTYYPQSSDKNKISLKSNGKLCAETTVSLDSQRRFAFVYVESSRPLTDAIEKVWLVPESPLPKAVWLTFARNEPTHVMVNWVTERAEASAVRYGSDEVCASRAVPDVSCREPGARGAEERKTLHHVEIPFPTEGNLFYRLETGGGVTEAVRVEGFAGDELRVAMVADWGFAGADVSAILKDRIHLLVTGGDQVAGLHGGGVWGDAAKTNLAPHLRLLGAYPALFRQVPVMPVLGNHDREIRPRGDPKTLKEPVYDVEATAYRMLFPLPDKGWCWRFEAPAFGVRFVGLDLNHVQDLGSLLQTCHDYREGSEQLAWYRGVMETAGPRFIVTLNNERSSAVRGLAKGEWARLMRMGTLTATGFGYFAERAELAGYAWYNTSLKGKGDVYRDPHSQFLAGEDSYLLFRFNKGARALSVEIKRLSDGGVLDASNWPK